MPISQETDQMLDQSEGGGDEERCINPAVFMECIAGARWAPPYLTPPSVPPPCRWFAPLPYRWDNTRRCLNTDLNLPRTCLLVLLFAVWFTAKTSWRPFWRSTHTRINQPASFLEPKRAASGETFLRGAAPESRSSPSALKVSFTLFWTGSSVELNPICVLFFLMTFKFTQLTFFYRGGI